MEDKLHGQYGLPSLLRFSVKNRHNQVHRSCGLWVDSIPLGGHFLPVCLRASTQSSNIFKDHCVDF